MSHSVLNQIRRSGEIPNENEFDDILEKVSHLSYEMDDLKISENFDDSGCDTRNKRKFKNHVNSTNSAPKKSRTTDEAEINAEQVEITSIPGKKFENQFGNNNCYFNSVLNGLLALDKYKQKFEHLSGWFELLEVSKIKVLNKDNINLSFNCLKCVPHKKVKTHHRAIMSNLKSHVDHVHKTCKSEFEKLKPAAQNRGVRAENIDLNASSTSNLPSQPQHRQTKIGENVVSQAQVNKACKDYIIDGLMPYTHVHTEAFKKLVKSLQPTKSVPDFN